MSENVLRLRIVFVILLFTNVKVWSAVQFRGIDLRDNSAYAKDFPEDRPLVLYFLSSSCPCSQAHFDHLNQLQKEFPQFNYLAFHANKLVPSQKAFEYFSKYKIEFPVLYDLGLEYADKYQALKTPHIFVIGRNNEVLFQGGATDSRNPAKAGRFYLREALQALKDGKDIDVKDSKTIGCYIQR